MKKISVLFLLLALIFAIIACNNNAVNDLEEQDRVYEIINERVVIGTGTQWELDGLLTLPKDAEGRLPAVVLVHGSGPLDMDSTIFENRPFLEIAEYLASNGIAVIRYNKRTFTHGAEMMRQLGGSLTVWEETIEDAILAAEILRADPRIDENRVFILGHSLGGMLAPRIHAYGGDFAGLILFAGSPRSLMEIIFDQQLLFIMETMEGEELEQTLALIYDGMLEGQIEAILNMSAEEAKAADSGMGASLYYFRDLLLNPAEYFINNITAPFLVMHADNDFQVFTDRDFAAYKNLLGERDNVIFKLYEGLNHLFMPSTVTRSIDILDEYRIKANIDEQVLRDIVNWIRAN